MSADESDSLIRAVAVAPPIDPPVRRAPTAAAAPAPSAPDLVDTSSFVLTRSRLRFAHAETEAAYRAWHAEQAVPFTRVGMVTSIVGFVIGLIALRVGRFDGFRWFAAGTVLVMPLLGACIAMSYQPRLHRWLLPACAFANVYASLFLQFVCYRILHRPDFAVAILALGNRQGFTTFRLRPGQAAFAVLFPVALHQYFLVAAFVSGRVGLGELVGYSALATAAYASGLLASVTIDRVARSDYRKSRIIALQRETIDRLQSAELQRQVAERSRALSDALARLTDAPRTPRTLAPGDVVDERYKIMRVIGKGGMGQVHEVERLTDGKLLALKTLSGVPHREALARFAREAQVAAEVAHPNIVSMLDIGVTRSGTLFLVMELVAGASLEAERSRYGDVKWAVAILRQIAAALAAMHARGIVHRDLKPSNILLDGTTVKVADFGLAAVVDHPERADTLTAGADAPPARPALTHTGVIMGTPLYMAPELADGARQAGPSSDIFSFGVVAYELLAKELPFVSPPVHERLAGRSGPSPRPLTSVRPISPELCRLIDSCLAEGPDARPTADRIAVVLERNP